MCKGSLDVKKCIEENCASEKWTSMERASAKKCSSRGAVLSSLFIAYTRVPCLERNHGLYTLPAQGSRN